MSVRVEGLPTVCTGRMVGFNHTDDPAGLKEMMEAYGGRLHLAATDHNQPEVVKALKKEGFEEFGEYQSYGAVPIKLWSKGAKLMKGGEQTMAAKKKLTTKKKATKKTIR